jgi:AraC family ethanolamine operon transcriptional activator
MLLGASDRVTQWSFDMLPADIVVMPPLAEHHAVHCGGSSYAVFRLNPDEVPSIFGGDPWLSDLENWREKRRHRAHPDFGLMTTQNMLRLAGPLARKAGVLSEQAAEFWKRTIVECMAATIRVSLPSDDGGHLPSAMKLVRSVEEYLQTMGDHPVHISEICAGLGLSRRSLHRAFHEIFGIGPVTFLRQKRLCTVHSVLQASSPVATTVSAVAIEQGFVELGRFAHDYHLMFGEYPSQTLGALTGSEASAVEGDLTPASSNVKDAPEERLNSQSARPSVFQSLGAIGAVFIAGAGELASICAQLV